MAFGFLKKIAQALTGKKPAESQDGAKKKRRRGGRGRGKGGNGQQQNGGQQQRQKNGQQQKPQQRPVRQRFFLAMFEKSPKKCKITPKINPHK